MRRFWMLRSADGRDRKRAAIRHQYRCEVLGKPKISGFAVSCVHRRTVLVDGLLPIEGILLHSYPQGVQVILYAIQETP